MKAKQKGTFRVALAIGLLVMDMSVALPGRADIFTSVGSMITPRLSHTATLMQNGKVLVTGGSSGANILASAEMYDPATGAWSPAGVMVTPRSQQVAVLLTNGKVLVAGGTDGTNMLSSAEIYDSVSGNWSSTGAMHSSRKAMAAVRLPNGLILAAGGFDGTNYLATAELYDPNSGNWTTTGSFGVSGRQDLNLAVLQNGQVLLAGGDQGDANSVASGSYLYDPSQGTWSAISGLTPLRTYATLTVLPDGRALMAGGKDNTGIFDFGMIFDPSTNGWSNGNSMGAQYYNHTATLLPNGQMLCTGQDRASTNGSELFNPATGLWSKGAVPNNLRSSHTATLLPDGRVLLAGGLGTSSALASAELYDSTVNSMLAGSVTNAASLTPARFGHSSTLLGDGTVLIAGGYETGIGLVSSAQRYYPATGTWTDAGSMPEPRIGQTATLLPNGKVLVAGGYNTVSNNDMILNTAALYDPVFNSWSSTGSMATARKQHSATLLLNGKLLVAGGFLTNTYTGTAEIYDPATGTWTATGSLYYAQGNQSAILLPNGKVLVSGGAGFGALTPQAELYDPATGAWTVTDSLSPTREIGATMLLPNGKVIVAGGYTGRSNLTDVSLYDFRTGNWTAGQPMLGAGSGGLFYLMPGGKVLLIDGIVTTNGSVFGSQIYDPATGGWTIGPALPSQSTGGTPTFLPGGQLLVSGGENQGGYLLTNCLLFNLLVGLNTNGQPQISTITSPISPGGDITVTGNGFAGIPGGSSGNTQDSATDYPLLQLQHLDSGRMIFVPVISWSGNSIVTASLNNFPPGFALATVIVNGISSTGSIVNVSAPVPTPPRVKSDRLAAAGGLQLSFTNAPGALFGVWAATNPTTPATNWIPLGAATEVSPGQFQFTDTQTANGTQRFYSLRAP